MVFHNDNARDLSREVLVALRRITQAIELHSRQLVRSHGLTGPQLIILEEIARNGEMAVTELARAISLSQATVTGILLRLERQGLISRLRGIRDKRNTLVSVTEKGKAILDEAPPLLQETFVRRFADLPQWEQLMILSSLHHIVHMMQARSIDASPFLVTGPIHNENETKGQ
ncbi:transcriptional regulator, MarR family [Desulfobotulus alkaliphilus]|uniref:Transcriptional regulator, MarR family n=1 Tax=Desulfobotulus alkaliphilus TaxID=622671 RepID=A0A562RVT9_9BACT|nr:MarR family transcriptional regulator [Desulfobotulus alkaliphilus]TWI73191.1 transcriptional regulator, MarR family [Desulfobotulus alkaliphilus]